LHWIWASRYKQGFVVVLRYAFAERFKHLHIPKFTRVSLLWEMDSNEVMDSLWEKSVVETYCKHVAVLVSVTYEQLAEGSLVWSSMLWFVCVPVGGREAGITSSWNKYKWTTAVVLQGLTTVLTSGNG
jgi:hypothetical protein